jgi:hypothetical protein
MLNLDSSMAAIMPVGPAPAIKTGFKSSLMFALQAPLFRGTLQVPNQAIGVATQFQGLARQEWKSVI